MAPAPETELDRLRRRIAELEARVAELEVSLDSVPVLISYMGRDERYKRVNRAYESLFGVPTDQIVGRSVLELMGEANYAKLKIHLDRVFAGEHVAFQTPFLHRDGTLHDADITYTPHKNASGVVSGIIVCVRDISQQNRAWAAARERERDLLSVLNHVPDVISRYNRDLRFVFTSASVEKHTGFPPEHFVGKSHAELGFPEPLCKFLEDGLREVFATGVPKQVSFELPAPDGELRQFEAVGVPEFGDSGTVESVLTITHDISSRLRAEKELRQSQERQRLAVEAGQVGLWHWDIENNRVEWSDMIYEIHGLERGAFGGTVEDFAMLIHPEDRERVSAELSSALAGRSPYHVEFRAVRPDGQIRWIYANAKVLFADGKPAQMVGAMLDMTESKAAAEALSRANEELRRANEDLNQFAYSASHDLKEPLRMIALYTQLFRRKYSENFDGDGHRYLGYAIDGARRMEHLLRGLLTYTEAITSESEAQMEMVNMDRVMEIVRANLMAAIDESGAEVTSDPLPLLPWRETQAVQVLQNLIGNAIKYRDPERAPRVHVTCERHLRSWQLSVSDNGIGVDARYHDRIFRIFKRLHSPEKYEGTGIGLAICQKIVERNGGRIWIESEPGRGSTFYFTCPAA
jgi:PAS domain S-box-containing protein